MPRVRNEAGTEHDVPEGHWALTDPRFEVITDAAREGELPAPPPAPKPKAKPKKSK